MAGKSGESVSISVPYRNLRKDVEVEMVTTKHGNENASSSADDAAVAKDCSLVTLVLSCTVAAGVQFGWALQLSLLTPYIQVVTFWHFLSQ